MMLDSTHPSVPMLMRGNTPPTTRSPPHRSRPTGNPPNRQPATVGEEERGGTDPTSPRIIVRRRHASHKTVVLIKAAHSGPSVCLRARAPCPLCVSCPGRIADRAFARAESLQAKACSARCRSLRFRGPLGARQYYIKITPKLLQFERRRSEGDSRITTR